MCCRTLLAHKQTHGHEGNKKKTRNRDFRGDFEKRRKLIPGGALLTFARLSFQSFFREPKLGLKNGRIWGGKKEKKKEEIERDKWQRGSEDKGWRMNTMRSFREKEAQGRVAVSKTKRKLERFFFNTFFHNSRKTAYLPSFSSSSSSSFSPSNRSSLISFSFPFLTVDGITYTFQVSYYSERANVCWLASLKVDCLFMILARWLLLSNIINSDTMVLKVYYWNNFILSCEKNDNLDGNIFQGHRNR